MKKLVLLFITAITIGVSAQESVVLRYNYKKGDIYKIKMKMTQEMGAIMAQTTNTVMSQKTLAVKGDTIVNESKIEKMTMDMVQGGQIMNYDSSKKDDELDEMGKMMKAQMAPILSAVITSKSSALGDVLDVTIVPNLPQVAQMGKQNSSVVYPKEAVKIGTTWSEIKNESGMTLKIEYTVKTISKKEIILAIGGDISGMATGTISGDMTIDKSSGVATNSKLQMKMSVQGQEMIMGVEGTIEKK
tara:strand:+ start:56805 stop:57539 length:735 start_codon:yes stop_codon:yes gene_type:complete